MLIGFEAKTGEWGRLPFSAETSLLTPISKYSQLIGFNEILPTPYTYTRMEVYLRLYAPFYYDASLQMCIHRWHFP
jgi:L,D-peptidoglycan transpeptidase YkuD (ErfK/YbiS/YcfS/YnhG family)